VSRVLARQLRAAALLCCFVAGCAPAGSHANDQPLPNNAIRLSGMMQELSTQPQFQQFVAGQVDKWRSDGLPLTPSLLDMLRNLILGHDWRGLDRFPGWTMRTLDLSVDGVERIAASKFPEKRRQIAQYLDIGSYELDKDDTVDLSAAPAVPSDLNAKAEAALQTDMGAGIVMGDGPDPSRWPLHVESQRLAEILNRLSLNGQPGLAQGVLRIGVDHSTFAASPAELVRALIASGHTVEVDDKRYFANFGHLHFKGRDVVMPFWIDTGVWVPGTLHALHVPVSHAELEMHVSGPTVNAVLAFYFGVDGKAEFRTTDTLNQAWVMERTVHRYRGAQVEDAVALMCKEVAAYSRAHLAHPELPFGGYYTLGVCQDSVAVVEKKLTGDVTLYPLTAQPEMFGGDDEVTQLLRQLPSDRRQRTPSLGRVLGTIPAASAEEVSLPEMRGDLAAAQAEWLLEKRIGGERHRRGRWWLMAVELIVVLACWLWIMQLRRSRRSHQSPK
jgi:hypothetical protein